MANVKLKTLDEKNEEVEIEISVSDDVRAQVLATQENTKALGRLAAIWRIR